MKEDGKFPTPADYQRTAKEKLKIPRGKDKVSKEIIALCQPADSDLAPDITACTECYHRLFCRLVKEAQYQHMIAQGYRKPLSEDKFGMLFRKKILPYLGQVMHATLCGSEVKGQFITERDVDWAIGALHRLLEEEKGND